MCILFASVPRNAVEADAVREHGTRARILHVLQNAKARGCSAESEP